MQGFYFGRPIPASEIAANILADFRKTLPAARPIRRAQDQAGQTVGWRDGIAGVRLRLPKFCIKPWVKLGVRREVNS